MVMKSNIYSTLAKLGNSKLIKKLPSYHFSHFFCHQTIFNPTNPIERHPLGRSQFNHNISLNLNSLSHVLHEMADAGDFRAVKSVHTHLIKLNSNGFVSLWNKLLAFYSKCGQFSIACQLFETMPLKDVVSFNTMISACVRNDYGLDAIYVYSKMKFDCVMPNHITLAGLIGACDGVLPLKLREVFHAQSIRYGLGSNVYVGSSLVDGYSKGMKLDNAMKAFGEIDELDLVSWNVMIDGCVRNNCKEHALRMFSWMLLGNVGFDGFTLTSIIKTCLEPSDLICGMALHGCAIKSGLSHEVPINNALITMYSKCEEGMKSAVKIFGIIVEPNIISWTAMISGFMQNGQNMEAIVFYRNMLRILRLGVQENDFSFISILPVYGNLANLEEGKQIHARIVKSWFGLDRLVNNALIDVYSKCGSLREAHWVFRTIGKHDKISYTTMITSLGQHGKGREALEILKEMTMEGLKPNDITFLGCLSACSHGGHVDEGIRVFRFMIDTYKIRPRREHFSCVVDMLVRAGRLVEAEKFIQETGVESDGFMWEALLGACTLHGEMTLGEKLAKRIIELQPNGCGPFVSLANIYADRGLWEDKGMVRDSLVGSRFKKEIGRRGLA